MKYCIFLLFPVMHRSPNRLLPLPECFKLYSSCKLSLWQWREIICSQSSQEYIFISVKTNYVVWPPLTESGGRYYHAYKHVVHLFCSLIQKLPAACTRIHAHTVLMALAAQPEPWLEMKGCSWSSSTQPCLKSQLKQNTAAKHCICS